MKKITVKITAIAIGIFFSLAAFAQQAEKKPKIDESNKATEQDKTTLATAGPQIVSAPKAMTVNEQPKPIVPGGEFKPMDTNVPVKNYAKTPPPDQTSSPVKVFEQQVLQKQ